jgi:hypothetical protein
MGVRIIELFTDDLDGAEADETIPFGYDGVDYTIDLSAKNAARMRKALRRYVEHSVKVTPARTRRGRPRLEETVAGRAQIRAWAWRTGDYPDLGGRGRIAQPIVDAYHAAHPS